MRPSFVFGFITTASEDEAIRIAGSLVGEGLAGCVNVVPRVRSIYRWKGEVCDEAETLLVFKTRKSLFEKLRKRVVELHPYEVPEVIACEIASGHASYLDWLRGATAPPPKRGRRATTRQARRRVSA